MPSSLQRKTNRIKVLEDDLTDKPLRDTICHNCKERHYLIARKTDYKNLFCTRCGALTPIRSIKRERGLAAPAIQQVEATTIAQSKMQTAARDRKPRSLNEKRNPLAEALEAKGFQIVDSQYMEPTPSSDSYTTN